MIRSIFTFLSILIFFNSCSNKKIEPIQPKIIPIPTSQIINKGVFLLSNKTSIKFDKNLNSIKKYSIDYLNKIGFSIKNKNNKNNFISFEIDKTIKNDEGYELNIQPNKIIIKSKNSKGAFYGFQTLTQLLPVTKKHKKTVAVQCLIIKDSPKFKYRGMHLDVSRHFFSVEFIKKYIEIISTLKMNTFHWHLTDDQGWRIEIKKYPKLQEISAYRDETLIGHKSEIPKKFDGKKYGGFYTQKEIKEIVEFAKQRQVTIIPEIEIPGHSQAAIAAYPNLGCSTKNDIKVATDWGIFKNVYCPKEETFKFLENVLDEVIALFPSKYIHIGGDEVIKTNWKKCKSCQELIKKEHLKDEHGLQNYFITKIEKYLNSKGKQIIGWDEILEGGLAPNATVMSWRGIKGAITAAKQKHNVILTPVSYCYFDYYQSKDQDESIIIGDYTPLNKVYKFNPIPDELTKEEHKYVLGGQGNVWTEYIPTSKKVEYMAFPRAIALSEILWSNPKKRNFSNFLDRLVPFLKRFDAMNVNYAKSIYKIIGEEFTKNGKVKYKLKTYINSSEIRYTLNGDEPTKGSLKYTVPININKNTKIKARIFKNEKPKGKIFTKEILFHKAVGKNITINPKPNKNYNKGGLRAIINGIKGPNKRFKDKEWLGFLSDYITITLNFNKPTIINKISTRFYNSIAYWIYSPKKIELNITLEDAREIKTTKIIEKTKSLLVNSNILLNKIFPNEKTIKAKTLKLKIKNFGEIPKGNQGEGNKAWTFIDELIIE